jgi:drug/metabolite transporter (DMT)-like permease
MEEAADISNRRLLSNLFLLFITLVWGATFTLTKDALQVVPVYPFLFVRFLLAAVALAVVCLASPVHRGGFTRRVWAAGTWLGLLLFGGYALQTLGLLTVSASVSGFLTGLNVVLVPIFAIPILRSIPRPRTWLAAMMAAVGLALFSGGDVLQMPAGSLYVLLCAVCLALQIVFVDKLGKDADALALATVELLVVAVCAFAASLLHPHQVLGPAAAWLQPAVIWATLINGLLGTSLAYWGQNICQKFTSAGEIAVIFSMEPVFAAVIAWFALGDRLSRMGWWGSVLIFASMLAADPAVKLPIRWQRKTA